MLRKNFPDRKAKRREEAIKRQARHDAGLCTHHKYPEKEPKR